MKKSNLARSVFTLCFVIGLSTSPAHAVTAPSGIDSVSGPLYISAANTEVMVVNGGATPSIVFGTSATNDTIDATTGNASFVGTVTVAGLATVGSLNTTGAVSVGTLTAAGAINTESLFATGVAGVTAQAYYHSSDARLKTDLHPIEHSLDKILALRGVEFNWKQNGRADMGVVAQNVADVFPNVVTHDKNGMMAVEYDSLIGPMIEAMRALKAENDQTKAELVKVRAELKQLNERTHLVGVSAEGKAIAHSTTVAQ